MKHECIRRLAVTIALLRNENRDLYETLWEVQDRSRHRERQLQILILALAERVAAQSELLSNRAERS